MSSFLFFVLWMRKMHFSHSDWSTKSQLFATIDTNKEKPSALHLSLIFNSFMFTSDPSYFWYSFFNLLFYGFEIDSLRWWNANAPLLSPFFSEWYCTTTLRINLNSASEIRPSFNACEINFLIKGAEDSARETVFSFSCFVIFLLSLPPPKVIAVEM